MNQFGESKNWKQKYDFSDAFDVILQQPESIFWIRAAFWNQVREILEEQKLLDNERKGLLRRKRWKSKHYRSFKVATNGKVLVNPKFTIQDWKLEISAVIGKYLTYHAWNSIKNWFGDNSNEALNEQPYKVLSAGALIFHSESWSFYLYKRPDDSQEYPGEIDITGGCINTTDWLIDWKVDPKGFVAQRIERKCGISIDPQDLQFLWVQEFQKRGFYNLVYLYTLHHWEKEKLNMKNLSELLIRDIMKYASQDNPGWSWLTLAMKYIDKKMKVWNNSLRKRDFY